MIAAERGLEVDHTTIYRWVIKFTPGLEKAVRRLKRPPGRSWFLDEIYITVKGQWKYLYRAVDKEGNTVDLWGEVLSLICPRMLDSPGESFVKGRIFVLPSPFLNMRKIFPTFSKAFQRMK